MRRLTIEVEPRITSVYEVDVDDDFDVDDQEALGALAHKLMEDHMPLSHDTKGISVTVVVSVDAVTLVP